MQIVRDIGNFATIFSRMKFKRENFEDFTPVVCKNVCLCLEYSCFFRADRKAFPREDVCRKKNS